MTRKHMLVLFMILILSAQAIFTTIPAHAGGVVTNCSDDADFSSKLSGGTVTFNCGAATIVLSGTKTIATDTTIDGGGTITLSGNNAVRLFSVNNAVSFTLKNITLEKGYGGSGDGGAIVNDGYLTLNHATIQFNHSSHHGGAIATTNRLDIISSTLSYNIASQGGALYADASSADLQVTISGSVFHHNDAANTNQGGAIYALSAPLNITASEFANNTAGSGGAIYAVSSGEPSTITGSLFHDNQTTGAYPNANGSALLVDDTPVNIEDSTLRNNNGQSGGAIYVMPTGLLTVMNSTLRDNTSTNGGGIDNHGMTSLTRVTLSGNHASHGGGIDNFGALLLTNVTLSGNKGTYGGGLKNEDGTAALINVTLSNNSVTSSSGGGIFNVGANTHLHLKNVIVDNSPNSGNCNFSQLPDSSIFNLSSDNTCHFGAGRDGVNLLLGPLAHNGGSTQTHLPRAGSPALDNGTDDAPNVDQRGILRPQGAAFDVGAVERQWADAPFSYLPLIRQ